MIIIIINIIIIIIIIIHTPHHRRQTSVHVSDIRRSRVDAATEPKTSSLPEGRQSIQ